MSVFTLMPFLSCITWHIILRNIHCISAYKCIHVYGTYCTYGIGMSPSVWWNSGDLATVITQNYKEQNVAPKSVIMQLGSQEGVSYITTNAEPVPWEDNVKSVLDAYQEIGMGVQSSEDVGVDDDDEARPELKSNLVYFQNSGGMHTLTSWGDVFTYGLPLMYATNFPSESYTMQRNDVMNVLYPPVEDDGASDDESDHHHSADIAIVVLSILLFISTVSCVVTCVCWHRERKLRDQENKLISSNL